MNDDYVHIAVLLDRTGSMESIRDDTIGGFNAFLEQQKAQPGLATLTLVQFDTQNPYEVVHRFKALQDVPPLDRQTFVPRAATPLLDAMGRAINDLEQSLAAMEEATRPGRVVVVVVTDGQENSSREFQKDQVKKMIQEKQEGAGWQFVFLSADMDAINDALESGVRQTSAMLFCKSAEGTAAAWGSASRSLSNYRSRRSADVRFTEEDRAKADQRKPDSDEPPPQGGGKSE